MYAVCYFNPFQTFLPLFLCSDVLGVTFFSCAHFKTLVGHKRKLNMLKYPFLFLPLILWLVCSPFFAHDIFLSDSISRCVHHYYHTLLTPFLTAQCPCIIAVFISTWLLVKCNFLYVNRDILCHNAKYQRPLLHVEIH